MYDIAVLGNACVDCLASVSEDVLTKYNMKKGDFCHFDQTKFLKLHNDVPIDLLQAGGATANTAWVLAQLEKKPYFLGRIADDPAGVHFFEEMTQAGVAMQNPEAAGRTMEIFVLVTPDGERTFAEPGSTIPHTPETLDIAVISQSKWLVIEGFVLLDQMDTVRKAVKIAKEAGVKTALTLAPPFVMKSSIGGFHELVDAGVDLIFSDEEEFEALESLAGLPLKEQMNKTPRVMTRGGKGASFFDATGQETFVATTPADTLVDTTGAGDTFAAGFWYEYLQDDQNIEKALKTGHILAAKVIQQMGARLKGIRKDMVAA